MENVMDKDFAQKFDASVEEDRNTFCGYYGSRRYYGSGDSSPRSTNYRTPWLLEDTLRQGGLTALEALHFIARLPSRNGDEESLLEGCLAKLSFYVEDPLLYVAVMNIPRIFHILSDSLRWKIRNHVTQDPELLKQVSVGWVGGRNARDLETYVWLNDVAPFTHSLECIQDGGDATALKADEYLYNRVSQGLGPEGNASKKTAEFLAGCHVLSLEGMPILRRVQMASEMIIMLIGHQTRRDREIGMDESIRLRDQKLRTLTYLQNVITNAMTLENAGVVLRWAMSRHRHHQWFWQRLTSHVKRCQWNIGKVEHVQGFGLGTVRYSGSRRFVVLVSENNVYEIKVEQTVMIPPHRTLGKPVQEDENLTVYRGTLQPFLPPTKSMQDAIDCCNS